MSEDDRQKQEQAQKDKTYVEESQKVEVEMKPEDEHNKMDDLDRVELEAQPMRRSDARYGSPVKQDHTEFESGPSSSTDVRVPLQHRDPV